MRLFQTNHTESIWLRQPFETKSPPARLIERRAIPAVTIKAMSNLPLPIAAFLAGLISFLSPCVLPLVPGYVSLISGAGVEELKSAQGQLMRRVMVNSIGFILGFSVVFITLGAVSTGIGQLAASYKHTLSILAGVIVIIFGIHLTGIYQIKWLLQDTRLHSVKGSSTIIGAFVIGFAFAFGWTPCLGPILTVILGLASQEATVAKGIVLLGVYSLGLAVPFLLTSLLMGRFLDFYRRFRSHMHALEVASGALMIGLGVLLLLGKFTLISTWLSFLERFAIWLEGITTKNGPAALIIVGVVVLLAFYLGLRKRPELESKPEASAITPSEPGSTPQPVPASSTRNPLALVFAAVVVAGMLWFGFHMARRQPAGTPQHAAAVAPDFTLESLDGKQVSLSGLRGKAVLLNFWATWCVPCKIEMPWLVELQAKYGPQGLQIVGVAIDDSSKEDIAKFTKDMGVNYTVLLGKNEVADAYAVPAMPESFFIGRDGKIVDKIIGLRGKSDIEDGIKTALKTQSTTSSAAAHPVQ
jgi:cytochrome c-type biogenesis protein